MLRILAIRCCFLFAWVGLPLIAGLAGAHGEDLVQPAGTWTRYGGGPANNASNRTKPLVRPTEVAWTYTFKGNAVGEPLVWNDKVVLYIRPSDTQAEVHLLDLATGKRRGPPLRLKTEAHLLPTLWRDRIALCYEPGAFRVYRLGRQKLTRAYEVGGTGGICHLMMVGRRVYYHDAFGHNYALDGQKLAGIVSSGRAYQPPPRPGVEVPEYGVPGSRVDSNFVFDDDSVYSVWYDVAGNAFLHTDSGRRHGMQEPLFLGHHGGKRPEGHATLSLFGPFLLVKLGSPLDLKGDAQANTVVLEQTGKVRSPWSIHNFLDLVGKPCGSSSRWVAAARNKQGRVQLLLNDAARSKKGSSLILASDDGHPEFLKDMQMSMAGNVLYRGRYRIDLETLEIYEPLPVRPLSRVVPARDTLLMYTDVNELTALREVKEGDPLSDEYVPAGTLSEPAKGQVVESDGRIRRRKLSWSDGKPLASGKPLPRKDVLIARARDGSIAYAPSAELAMEGLAYLIAKKEGPGYAKLATAAIKVRALQLAERYAGAADDAGAGKSVSAWTRKRFSELRAERDRKAPDPEKVRQVLEAEQELRRKTTELIWTSYEATTKKGAGTAGSWAMSSELLRGVLARVPDHEGATRAVREAIPEGVPLPKGFKPKEWLLLADAVHSDPVRIADPNGEDKAAFAFARLTWRGDLIGLRSRNLLILTQDPQPAQIAACLATGELVCRTLERLFGAAKEGGPPLVLHLFPTRDAYLRVSGGGRGGHGGSMVDNSAGHYVPSLNISRIFLPAGEDPFAQVFETYTHELVHHWLQARCPLPRSKNVRGHGVSTAGFWLVEGVAELFSEFQYDLRRGKVGMINRRAASLDAVAHAPDTRLLPWKQLLSMDQAAFARLRKDDVVPVSMRWRVGLRRQMSSVDMFYSQATSVAQYLFHHSDGGRALLLDLVLRYYEGSLRPGAVEAALKQSSDAIGRAVTRYAKAKR